jgi:hypothetical protein
MICFLFTKRFLKVALIVLTIRASFIIYLFKKEKKRCLKQMQEQVGAKDNFSNGKVVRSSSDVNGHAFWSKLRETLGLSDKELAGYTGYLPTTN